MTGVPRYPDFESAIRYSFGRQAHMSTLGVSIERIAPGECDLRLPYSPAFCQQNGYMHAGALASVADSANGYAASAWRRRGRTCSRWSSRSTCGARSGGLFSGSGTRAAGGTDPVGVSGRCARDGWCGVPSRCNHAFHYHRQTEGTGVRDLLILLALASALFGCRSKGAGAGRGLCPGPGRGRGIG